MTPPVHDNDSRFNGQLATNPIRKIGDHVPDARRILQSHMVMLWVANQVSALCPDLDWDRTRRSAGGRVRVNE